MVRRRAPAAGGRAGGRGGGLRGYLRIPAADLLRRHRRGLRLRGPHVPPAWRGTHGAGGPHRRRRRRLVAALGFREVGIYEKHGQLDGVRQQVHSFSEEDAPVSMGIVLDLSGSMREVLSPAKEALRALMKDANPADEAFLNTVSTSPRAYSGFTHDFDEVLSRVAFEKAGGDTALIDTIYGSLHELRSGIHARKALLVISDGMDNHSRYSKQELLDRAVESDAQIYTKIGRA